MISDMTTTNKTTNKVSVIGLGAMGAVLAQHLLSNGFDVTVWNRSSEKAQPLVQQGASYYPDINAAVQASPLIIICVTDYAISRHLLDNTGLAGKVLVQLSTGTPQDARDAAAWAREKGADYLDGAILATPQQMGKPDTPIFLSGPAGVYQQTEPALKALAGTLLYMGDAVGAAAAWDLAVLSSMFGMMTGFFHGARIMEQEGMRVDALGGMIAEIAPVLGQMVKSTSEDIQKEDYSNPESSLEICRLTFELLIRQAKEAGINAEIPSFELQLFNKGRDAGYGNDKLGALIKTLR
jgi:3-hydroxyisobutyrate dehydrogenase-like beta-hydroxyacid dehydrogenase